jgi:hypothetical protein
VILQGNLLSGFVESGGGSRDFRRKLTVGVRRECGGGHVILQGIFIVMVASTQ